MKNTLLIGFLGIIIGAIASGLFFKSQTPKAPDLKITQAIDTTKNTQGLGTHTEHITQPMAMEAMTGSLIGKTGDEFDKAFLEEMILHHEGAVEMAKSASTSAKHDEIKNLSVEIISAQEKEIMMMKQWQKEWGY